MNSGSLRTSDISAETNGLLAGVELSWFDGPGGFWGASRRAFEASRRAFEGCDGTDWQAARPGCQQSRAFEASGEPRAATSLAPGRDLPGSGMLNVPDAPHF
jgi:hypothetical protein